MAHRKWILCSVFLILFICGCTFVKGDGNGDALTCDSPYTEDKSAHLKAEEEGKPTWNEHCQGLGMECIMDKEKPVCKEKPLTCDSPYTEDKLAHLRATDEEKPTWNEHCQGLGMECIMDKEKPVCKEKPLTCDSPYTEDKSAHLKAEEEGKPTWNEHCQGLGMDCIMDKEKPVCKEKPLTCDSPYTEDKLAHLRATDEEKPTWNEHCQGLGMDCIMDKEKPVCKEKPKDPCKPDPCHNGGKCSPKEGTDKGYICDCLKGYSPEDDCGQIDACKYTDLNCGNKDIANCVNVGNTATCKCNKPNHVYNFNGTGCEEPVKAAPCKITGCTKEGQVCSPSGKCVCGLKYFLKEDKCIKKACEFDDLNECEQSCLNLADGKPKCGCFKGFKMNEETQKCEPTKVCNKECGDHGKCSDGKCVCNRGYLLDKEGKCEKPDCSMCETKKCDFKDGKRVCDCSPATVVDIFSCSNPCASEDARKACKEEGGMCVKDLTTEKGFRCENPCREKRKDCEKEMQVCEVNDKNVAKCVCPPGLKPSDGQKCKFDNTIDGDVYIETLKLKLPYFGLTVQSKAQDLNNIKTSLTKAMKVAYGEELKSIDVFEKDCFKLGVSDYECKIGLHFKKGQGMVYVENLKHICEERVLTEGDIKNYCLLDPVAFDSDSIKNAKLKKSEPEDICLEDTKLKNVGEGSYICSCKDYFTPEESQGITGLVRMTCKAWCQGLCQNEGKCEKNDDEIPVCKCDADKWQGAFCQDAKPEEKEEGDDKKVSSANQNTVIVGVVLGILLLITIIVAGVMYKRAKQNADSANMSHNLDDYEPRIQYGSRGGRGVSYDNAGMDRN